MEIIISHQRTDFDGLAAMVAAQKIYPQAKMVFAGGTTNNVKEYMSLYKNRIPIKYPSDIDKSQVTKIIIVDTRVAFRLGSFSELVQQDEIEVVVYDHHLNRQNCLQDVTEIIEPLGATTTILVEQIRQRKIGLTSFEATLFTLGIYEDTGCLVFNSTTARDAKVVAYLLELGANLEIVEKYIDYSLNRQQQQLFNKLLDSAYKVTSKGFCISFFQAEVEEYIPDISLLAHKLDELHNVDALFVLVKSGNKVLIIGRSNHDSINVAQVLNYFGGGGHARAAAATIKRNNVQDLIELQQELLKVAKENIVPSVLAENIMSSPVKTVTPDTSMREADELMLRYGHSGLVVEENERLVGIISRRDIDKVRNHNLLHAPVKGYMSTNVVTIEAETSLKEAQDLIVKHDIGRLPVTDQQGELVGIITRSDLLKLLYGTDDYIKNRQNLYGRSLVELQEKRYNIDEKLKLIKERIMEVLKLAARLADFLEADLYLVGGFVRDLLLEQGSLDLDLVVEGNGIKFARKLAQELNGDLNVHHEFETATISLGNNLNLDVSTTRVEYYSDIASLPEIEPGSIQQDLFRRDFTINALAIQLNQDSFGQLVDFFDGKVDLEQGLIRLLHNFSLHDDPTRIFRGLRFASRYQYQFESETEKLIRQAVDLDVVDKLSNNRLIAEVKKGLNDAQPLSFIKLLFDYDLLSYLSNNISWNQTKEELAVNLSKIIEWSDSLAVTFNIEEWLLYFTLLVAGLEKKEIKILVADFNLSSDCLQRLLFSLEVDQVIEQLLVAEKKSRIYFILKELAIEDILFLLARESKLIERVKLYLENLQWLDIEVSGEDIIDLGYQPAPGFKKVLEEVKKAKLDGEVEGYQQERQFLEEYIKEKGVE
ncbi:CBS domain-containing protein [Natroniella acetigena]|uniref:CBS domain-containing protein n=1 Tax=Natroniella acetigena TaxID=52004 RepID=UPI00200A9AE0|nr:CBS domain-containing protein [Natroniella acetigena]MCK8827096.1 CBS domain-containing protein [Natroniella acetigena]